MRGGEGRDGGSKVRRGREGDRGKGRNKELLLLLLGDYLLKDPWEEQQSREGKEKQAEKKLYCTINMSALHFMLLYSIRAKKFKGPMLYAGSDSFSS